MPPPFAYLRRNPFLLYHRQKPPPGWAQKAAKKEALDVTLSVSMVTAQSTKKYTRAYFTKKKKTKTSTQPLSSLNGTLLSKKKLPPLTISFDTIFYIYQKSSSHAYVCIDRPTGIRICCPPPPTPFHIYYGYILEIKIGFSVSFLAPFFFFFAALYFSIRAQRVFLFFIYFILFLSAKVSPFFLLRMLQRLSPLICGYVFINVDIGMILVIRKFGGTDQVGHGESNLGNSVAHFR